MQRDFELVIKSLGYTYPNPLVGCVIVKDEKIISEGWHKRAGEDHAEVIAIKKIKEKKDLKKSTLYVSLEPCNHIGKTPPCSDLIIKSGIQNVVIGCLDPNVLVKGKGAEKLKKAGINVTVGVCENQAKKLNKRFFCYHEKKRPYVILKWAESKDGFIGPEKKYNDIGKVKNLTKKFHSTIAVNNISFEIKKNKTLGLLGPNGCGKTTSIGMMLGLITPSSGEIFIDEICLEPKNIIKLLSKMNFASPYIELPKKLTVKQNLEIYARLYGVEKILERISETVEDLGLENFLNKKTGELSSGQKNRVSLAKSLINKPKLLFLDEPTASLDPDVGDFIREYLEKYKKNNELTILLASHNMKEVERLCDSVVMMKNGEIVDKGTCSEIVNKHGRKTLEDTFLKIARSNNEME